MGLILTKKDELSPLASTTLYFSIYYLIREKNRRLSHIYRFEDSFSYPKATTITRNMADMVIRHFCIIFIGSLGTAAIREWLIFRRHQAFM